MSGTVGAGGPVPSAVPAGSSAGGSAVLSGSRSGHRKGPATHGSFAALMRDAVQEQSRGTTPASGARARGGVNGAAREAALDAALDTAGRVAAGGTTAAPVPPAATAALGVPAVPGAAVGAPVLPGTPVGAPALPAALPATAAALPAAAASPAGGTNQGTARGATASDGTASGVPLAMALDNGAVALAGSSQLTPAPPAAFRPSAGPAERSAHPVSDTGAGNRLGTSDGLGTASDAVPDAASANGSAGAHGAKAATAFTMPADAQSTPALPSNPAGGTTGASARPSVAAPGATGPSAMIGVDVSPGSAIVPTAGPSAVVPGAEKSGAAVVPGASVLPEVKDGADAAALGAQSSSVPPSATDPAPAQPSAQVSLVQPAPAAAFGTPLAAPQPAAASPAPAPVPVHPPLVEQLARPLFTLSTAPSGQHVMTVQVVPDNLGPVTVRAHIGPEGVRIEMLSGTTVGQDGLRSLLPDLKRDLAGHGFSPTLTVVSGYPSTDASSGDPSSRQQVPFSSNFQPGGDRGGNWVPRDTPEEFGRDVLRPGPEEPPGLPDSGTGPERASLDITV